LSESAAALLRLVNGHQAARAIQVAAELGIAAERSSRVPTHIQSQ
jgi:hypothetical protein